MDSDLKKWNENRANKELPKFVSMLDQHISFEDWEFKQAFYGLIPAFIPTVIYDSGKCRVKFMLHKGDPRDGYDVLVVEYGRAHAPNNQMYMDYKGKKCHAWHDVRLALKFLDGISPSEAVKVRFQWPRLMEQFIQTQARGTLSHVEWTAKMHVYVWKHYGHRLFNLFDLRHPELWKQYTAFVKEFYRIEPDIYDASGPSRDSIC